MATKYPTDAQHRKLVLSHVVRANDTIRVLAARLRRSQTDAFGNKFAPTDWPKIEEQLTDAIADYTLALHEVQKVKGRGDGTVEG